MGKHREIAFSVNRPCTSPRGATSARPRRFRTAGNRAPAGPVGGDYQPPEQWYEPCPEATGADFRVVVQRPGSGYRHAVTARDVRSRLAALPAWMLEPLEVVQLSRMTRKKRAFPCYGMQWGATLYLYPVETSRIECFARPPLPSERIEARMYGGRWRIVDNTWCLLWSEQAIRDFYLNNVLIHELAHLLDQRNTSNEDRERFAEWFAYEYGYKPSRGKSAGRVLRRVNRRHGPRR